MQLNVLMISLVHAGLISNARLMGPHMSPVTYIRAGGPFRALTLREVGR